MRHTGLPSSIILLRLTGRYIPYRQRNEKPPQEQIFQFGCTYKEAQKKIPKKRLGFDQTWNLLEYDQSEEEASTLTAQEERRRFEGVPLINST